MTFTDAISILYPTRARVMRNEEETLRERIARLSLVRLWVRVGSGPARCFTVTHAEAVEVMDGLCEGQWCLPVGRVKTSSGYDVTFGRDL
jgi:hypothetical protein